MITLHKEGHNHGTGCLQISIKKSNNHASTPRVSRSIRRRLTVQLEYGDDEDIEIQIDDQPGDDDNNDPLHGITDPSKRLRMENLLADERHAQEAHESDMEIQRLRIRLYKLRLQNQRPTRVQQNLLFSVATWVIQSVDDKEDKFYGVTDPEQRLRLQHLLADERRRQELHGSEIVIQRLRAQLQELQRQNQRSSGWQRNMLPSGPS